MSREHSETCSSRDSHLVEEHRDAQQDERNQQLQDLGPGAPQQHAGRRQPRRDGCASRKADGCAAHAHTRMQSHVVA